MQTLAEVGLERDGQIISGYDAAHDDEKNGGGEMISAAISVLRHTRGEIANDKFGNNPYGPYGRYSAYPLYVYPRY